MPGAADARRRPGATVFSRRLHDHLLGKATAKTRLNQDTSLQIAGCPGVTREVETVCNSILHNLHTNPSLRQTDIAVLVTDMPRYRPALQAVFERPPARIQYNLVDFNAAGAVAAFGQSQALGMIDLALESFSRSMRVFGSDPGIHASSPISASIALRRRPGWNGRSSSASIKAGTPTTNRSTVMPRRRFTPGGSDCSGCGWGVTWK